MTARSVILLALCTPLFVSQAWAHSSFRNRLQITPGDSFWMLQWSAPVEELNLALGLDKDGNQLIHWWEIEAKQALIHRYAKQHFDCQPRLSCGPLRAVGELQLLPASESVGARLVMHFRLPVYAEVEALRIEWLLAQNPYRPLVMQWFRGGWQAETVHTGATIELKP